MIKSITRHNFKQEVEQSSLPVVIDVYATWCGPCQHMAPSYEELAQSLNKSYTFGKLNVDEARDLAAQFGVSSVPTFLFFKNGQLIGSESGYMSKEDLQDKIENYLD